MKLEDIKIGMKVVPHSKSTGDNDFAHCYQWNTAKQHNQKFLYVVNIGVNEVVLNHNSYFKTGNHYLPSDIEPYQEPTMTITQEQFDNLKEGDIVNNKYNGDIFFQGKIGKVSFWVNSSGYSNTLSLADLQNLEYSLVTKPENYQGFLLGDYSDKIVVVAVSNNKEIHLNDSSTFVVGLLSKATKDGIYIKDFPTPFSYAQLINPTPFQLV